MKQKHALLLAFLITGLLASNLYLFSLLNKTDLESVLVARVIDADTLVLSDGRTLRLLNINSPEKSSPLSERSTNYMKQFENKTIKSEITELDKYKRSLARIYTKEGSYINLDLVTLGFASKFLVESSELSEFKEAETSAIENQQGIWKHSPNYNCISSTINEKEEFVTITNSCNSLSLSSWILKDESRKTFTFPNINLNKEQNLILYSGEGKNNLENENKELYWQQKTNVWNNDRDTLYIFDSNNNIVHFNSYGY